MEQRQKSVQQRIEELRRADLKRKEGAVRVRASSDDQALKIAVSHNGRGIPAEQLSKLGNIGVTFGKPGGNGLGLYQQTPSLNSTYVVLAT